jgi:nucleoside phosphorylase
MELADRIPTVLIIMALQREEDALLIARERINQLHSNGGPGNRYSPSEQITPPLSNNRYDQFFVQSADHRPKMRVVTVTLAEMGPLSSAAVTAEAIHDWRPDAIFLLGICAGIPNGTEVRLGDIIIGETVVDRDSGKLSAGKMQRTYPSLTCDETIRTGLRRFAARYFGNHSVTSLASEYVSCEPGSSVHGVSGFSRVRYPAEVVAGWLSKGEDTLQEILDKAASGTNCKHDRISAHIGVVLSGATVVKSISTRHELLKERPDAKGIEMEGAGIAAVLRRVSDRPRFALVKGVCDFADEVKDDRWQSFSAATSATLVLEFLLQMTDAEIRELPRKSLASTILSGRVPWQYKREGNLHGWQAGLVEAIGGIAAKECDSATDGVYEANLTQAHQYVLRARPLFHLPDPAGQIFVTAVERVSKFWFQASNSSEVASFIECQPKSTVRLFALESRKRSEKELDAIIKLLDQHRQQYEQIYIMDEDAYVREMESITWGDRNTVLARDFAVRIINNTPEAVWWLTSDALHATSILAARPSQRIPLQIQRFITWMKQLQSVHPNPKVYRWCDNDKEANIRQLRRIVKTPDRRKPPQPVTEDTPHTRKAVIKAAERARGAAPLHPPQPHATIPS